MLYSFLTAAIIAGISYSANDIYTDCNSLTSPSACFDYHYCGWYVESGQNCGYCTYVSHDCDSAAAYDCALRCSTDEVPEWATDSCYSKDDKVCGDQCSSTIYACKADAMCWTILNATQNYEMYYASESGCGSNDQHCKDMNNVFWKALNTSLPEYCWGSGNSDNSDSCLLYEKAVTCYAVNCSSDCHDCGYGCQAAIVDCLFDEDCEVAFFWLMSDIRKYNSSNPFNPYQIASDKNAYCNASSETSKYCNAKFDAVWDCLSESCFRRSCFYKSCETQAKVCYNDQECQNQLVTLLYKYPALSGVTPGILLGLVNYYCKIDDSIQCDNTNFKNLVNCYGSECCWDKDVCPEHNVLADCDHVDCLKDACVEVFCLTEAQACLNDPSGCGNALIAQGQWDHLCDKCLKEGNNATYCTKQNGVGFDCSVLTDSSAMMYLQYYCWYSSSCNSKVTDLMQCVISGCGDCGNDNSDHWSSTTVQAVSSMTPSLEFDYCGCMFDTCWDSVSACFLNEICWELFFSNQTGYGFESIFKSIALNENSVIPPVPTLVDNRVRYVYCKDKNCNEQFWNVWSCIWSPIFLGSSYYTDCGTDKTYFKGKTSGCGLADALYSVNFPPCAYQGCFGYVDDCLGDPSSECSTDFKNALSNGDLSACDLCNNCENCLNSAGFKNAYIDRCGSTGSDCSQDYDNLANCLYQDCAHGSSMLPGSQDTSCNQNNDKNTNNANMKGGLFILTISLMILVLSL